MLQCCVWVRSFSKPTCSLGLKILYCHSGDADLVTEAEDEWVSHQEEVSDDDEGSGDKEEISDHGETEKCGSHKKLLTGKYNSLSFCALRLMFGKQLDTITLHSYCFNRTTHSCFSSF